MDYLIITGKIVAALSFIIGTILLSLYLYLNHSEYILGFGFYFIIVAIIINSLLLLILLLTSALYQNYRFTLLKVFGIILLNIPVAIGYLYIVLSIEFPSKG